MATTTSREKKKLITNITRQQAEDAFAEFSRAQSNLKKVEAEMEIKITAVRENYSTAIDAYTKAKDEKFAVLQTYALENEGLFDKKKSLVLTHGVIGFRTGTPALKTLKGFTWKSVVNLVKEFLPDYLRTVEEVNKEALLAQRDNEEVNKQFTKCGVEVKQDENFFVEPKEEEAK